MRHLLAVVQRQWQDLNGNISCSKIDTLHLPVILTIENSDGRIAESIKANTAKKDQGILVMNSLQSVTNEQLLDGITYLKVMRENLSVLSKALN